MKAVMIMLREALFDDSGSAGVDILGNGATKGSVELLASSGECLAWLYQRGGLDALVSHGGFSSLVYIISFSLKYSRLFFCLQNHQAPR